MKNVDLTGFWAMCHGDEQAETWNEKGLLSRPMDAKIKTALFVDCLLQACENDL